MSGREEDTLPRLCDGRGRLDARGLRPALREPAAGAIVGDGCAALREPAARAIVGDGCAARTVALGALAQRSRPAAEPFGLPAPLPHRAAAACSRTAVPFRAPTFWCEHAYAVQRNGLALQYAGLRVAAVPFRAPTFWCEHASAVQRNGLALQYAGLRVAAVPFRAPTFWCEHASAVQRSGLALQYAGLRVAAVPFRARAFWCEHASAVQRNGLALQYAGLRVAVVSHARVGSVGDASTCVGIAPCR